MLKFHSCLAQKRSAKIRIDAESYQTIEPELIPEKSYKRWKELGNLANAVPTASGFLFF